MLGSQVLGGNRFSTIYSTPTNGNITFDCGTGYVKTGAGSPGHAPTTGGLYVPGILEVDGAAYFDAAVTCYASESINAQYNMTVNGSSYNGSYFRLGTSSVWGAFYMATDRSLQWAMGSDGYGNNAVHLVALANVGGNYAHTTMESDPTQYWHSRTAAATSTAQWGSVAHQTDHFVITTGTGGVRFQPADGALYPGKAGSSQADFSIITYDSEVTLSTVSEETAVSLTVSAGVILSAAIRVTQEIQGLTGAADHSIALGVNGTPEDLCHVHEGASSEVISVGKTAQYTNVPKSQTNALVLTVGGGADNIPTQGKVHVKIRYTKQDALTS